MRSEVTSHDGFDAIALGRVTERFRAGTGPLGDPVDRLEELIAAEAPLLAPEAVAALARDLADELVGLGALERLLADDTVTDVLVDGPGAVLVERRGRLEATGIELDAQQVQRVVERLVMPLGLRADRSHPLVDARREDGTRVAVVMPPVAPAGPLVALRRHSGEAFCLDRFGEPGATRLLLEVLRERLNIVVYGATGAGKTSLLTSLCSRLPREERLVLVEDTAELRPAGPNVVRLEARAGTVEGIARTDMRALVRAALRLRPDRIVVGEVRGAEAADMVWALSTGHRGSMSTLHADGPADALARLEVMVVMGLGDGVPLSAASAQVRNAVDVLIGVERAPLGARRVRRVDTCGPAGTEVIYEHCGEPGSRPSATDGAAPGEPSCIGAVR